MFNRYLIALVVGAILFTLVSKFSKSSGITEMAHESTQFHLNLVGSSIYEYHQRNAQWPTKIEDLAKTSLPAISPYWKPVLDDEVFVIVWHKALKPDPKDNAGQILVYHNKGTIATEGQSWVCWGDLRTEYIPTDDLRANLQKLKN